MLMMSSYIISQSQVATALFISSPNTIKRCYDEKPVHSGLKMLVTSYRYMVTSHILLLQINFLSIAAVHNIYVLIMSSIMLLESFFSSNYTCRR